MRMQNEVVEIVEKTQGLTLGWLQFCLALLGLIGSNLAACFGMVKWMIGTVSKRQEDDNVRVHKRIDEIREEQKACRGGHDAVQGAITERLERVFESSMQSDAALLEKLNEIDKKLAVQSERSKGVGDALQALADGTVRLGGRK